MIAHKKYYIYICRGIILLFIFVSPLYSFAQKDSLAKKDTTLVPGSKHSAKKAAILSAIIPGAGQIYNKKYWKAPIVWAMLGGSIYYFIYNQQTYIDFRNNYRTRVDADPNTFDNYLFLTNTQLKGQRDNARQSRDLSILIMAIAYSLNIIDANVDGHLYNFDMSDNLSLKVKPSYYINPIDIAPINIGSGFIMSCSIHFKNKPVYGF
ncbi:MAG: DUF5683 domain-containing protein [Bacteroidota bacterium]|nr:DUF5683 domain-containing protein [Bacteroidota bacterium]